MFCRGYFYILHNVEFIQLYGYWSNFDQKQVGYIYVDTHFFAFLRQNILFGKLRDTLTRFLYLGNKSLPKASTVRQMKK